ncbi:MAG: hypothetical protein WKF84_11685 [Pyrinomonadaceae bacterium]
MSHVSVRHQRRSAQDELAARAPGRCLRLYTAQDFAARPRMTLQRSSGLDLAEAAPELHAMGIASLEKFEWFEPPAEAQLNAAETLLLRLGAIDTQGALTNTGQRMLRLPLHPRLRARGG